MRKEKEEKEKEIQDLRSLLNQRRKNRGKNRVRRKDNMSGLDRLNVREVNHYIKKVSYPYLKILPKKWMKYSDHPKTMCCRVMSKVEVPKGLTKQIYWEETIRPLVNEKCGALKANFKEACKIQYRSKYLDLLDTHMFFPSILICYCATSVL